MFILAGFGDEISSDLNEQLDALSALGIKYLELRGAWGKNVLDFSDDEVQKLSQALQARGMAVSSIASPIGKIDIAAPFAPHLEDLRRMLDLAAKLSAPYLRLFSFYVPQGSHNQYRSIVLDHMAALTEAAQSSPTILLHENEKAIYGDIPERCAEILQYVNSPKLQAVFDPANFVQVGVVRPFTNGWPLLGKYVCYVHVKDAALSNGEVLVAGAGDGEVPALLQALKTREDAVYLSLEPHLIFAGNVAGYSGKDLYAQAMTALQEVLNSLE